MVLAAPALNKVDRALALLAAAVQLGMQVVLSAAWARRRLPDGAQQGATAGRVQNERHCAAALLDCMHHKYDMVCLKPAHLPAHSPRTVTTVPPPGALATKEALSTYLSLETAATTAEAYEPLQQVNKEGGWFLAVI